MREKERMRERENGRERENERKIENEIEKLRDKEREIFLYWNRKRMIKKRYKLSENARKRKVKRGRNT